MQEIVSLRHKIFAGTLAVLLSISIIFIPLSFVLASPITRVAVVDLTNNERSQIGIAPLKANYNLTMAAQNKADDMLKNVYFEHYHDGKSPWDWMKEAGYDFSSAGENLGIDFDDAESLVNAWMNSPTHRQNLVNSNFNEIGIGISQGIFGDHETTIVVQMFGKSKIDVELTSVNTNQKIAGLNTQNNNDVKDLYSSQSFWQKLVSEIKYIYSKTIGKIV